MDIQGAIEASRFKTTSPRTIVDAETRIDSAVFKKLERRGHEINPLGDWSAGVGSGQVIHVDAETRSFMGGADPRRDRYSLDW